jgi:hypothetical protein
MRRVPYFTFRRLYAELRLGTRGWFPFSKSPPIAFISCCAKLTGIDWRSSVKMGSVCITQGKPGQIAVEYSIPRESAARERVQHPCARISKEGAILDRQLFGLPVKGKRWSSVLTFATPMDMTILAISSLFSMLAGGLNPLMVVREDLSHLTKRELMSYRLSSASFLIYFKTFRSIRRLEQNYQIR